MRQLLTVIFATALTLALGQELPHCADPSFHAKVQEYVSTDVPLLDVDQLKGDLNAYVLLDAREIEEHETSHIPGAMYVGFEHAELGFLDSLDRSTPIAVYCSIGYRSDVVAKKLKKIGFTKVSNVYGGIFEWTNRGYPLVGREGEPTAVIHAYSRSWSRWVLNDTIRKVW